MQDLINLIVPGLVTGSIYALTAIGFTLLWQTSQTINFAQGEFVMLPAALVLIATQLLGLPLWLAVLVAVTAFVLLFGLGFRYLIVGPMLRHGVMPLAIATMALSVLMKEGVKDVFSAEPFAFPSPFGDASIRLFGVTLSVQDLAVLCSSAVVILALHLFVSRTRAGRQMQAVAQNPGIARILGVRVGWLIAVTFMINAALAVITSFLMSPIYLVKFSNGEFIGMAAFAAAIVGGFNQVRGALVGGLLLGVCDNLMAAYVSNAYRAAAPMLLLVVIILLRPQGLLGAKEERVV